ncbi:MAG: hypothetical protein Q8P41_31395 [Pseudomonadota bacterium]|nr:hypothetical protein [Pseudomonadota bacterium]
MLLTLALTSLAQASDVATTKKFGIGVASGPTGIAATGKFYLTDKAGISGYIGTSGWYHGFRANFEMEFYEIESWDFGRLDLYWDVGVDLGLWTWGVSTGLVGVGGGVGIELQFEKVPASVFVDAGLGIYPVNAYDTIGPKAGFGLIAPRGAAGGRWYF